MGNEEGKSRCIYRMLRLYRAEEKFSAGEKKKVILAEGMQFIKNFKSSKQVTEIDHYYGEL